jgi:hypothetical protein
VISTMTKKRLVKRARNAVTKGTWFGPGQCLKSVRTLAGAEGGTYDAVAGWNKAKYKRRGQYGPAGTFEWWSGGSHGHGHVAVSIGKINGRYRCVTLDYLRHGRMNITDTANISKNWHLHHLGYTTDINNMWVKA